MEVDSWDNLWGLLACITLRKCGHRIKYFQAARRDVLREVSPTPLPDERGMGWEAVAHDPTPAEAAILTETLEKVLAGLHERERPIVVLKLQGYTPAEISAQIGRSERTISRALRRVRKILDAMHADQGEDD